MAFVDLKWMSQGGVLLDGSGDLALTSDPLESMADIVRSRLKAALDGYKLYRTGADLKQTLGNAIDAELEVALRRRVVAALAIDFLPSNVFDVRTLVLGDEITVFVYLKQSLIATATASRNADIVQVK